MNLQLPTGKTIYISAYDYYFRLEDDDVELFFQSCVADDLGQELNNPFSNKIIIGKIEVEEDEE